MYFDKCKTLDELKAEYRRLAVKYHPDTGGDLETMKAVNAEHDRVFEVLKRKYNDSADEYHQTTETAEEFRDIINALLTLPGLEIELCGSWLWIGGNTLEHREKLRELGCKWSQTKKLWHWHHAEDGSKWYRGKRSMNEIRSKYGSQVFRGGREETNYTAIWATA